ncbi:MULTISPECIES: hypothetical protein [Methylococcus]|uniref:Uncharacterized protein n=1 Tax=Methylococcus capsulatus TaxID=414 RepID=A0ABZ2F0W3_METCP|nr:MULTISPECIES: hypothetical protein [Methylococcus]
MRESIQQGMAEPLGKSAGLKSKTFELLAALFTDSVSESAAI